MPTQSELQLYTLGIRFKQAMIVTRSVAAAEIAFVSAVIIKLIAAVDDLNPGTPFPIRGIRPQEDLQNPCRVFLRKVREDVEGDDLEDIYSELQRQLKLIESVFDESAITSAATPDPKWFKLGMEIVDGWNDEPPSGPENEWEDEDEDEDELLPTTGDEQSNETETVSIEGAGGCDEDVEVDKPVPWNWGNKERVDRLLEQLAMREEELFPPNDVELSQSPWLIDLPVSWLSWSRFEAGLLRLTSAVATTVDSPPPNPRSESYDLADLPPSYQKILEVVREAGKRLTGDEILNALSRKYGSASPGMTKQNLAVMRREKLLTNRTDTDPRGYGLPEWS